MIGAEAGRWSLANLSDPPERVLAGNGELTDSHAEWVQHSGMWSVFYYYHTNAVRYGTAVYAVEPGDMVFFAPGSIAGHSKIGPETGFEFITFDMPAKTGIRGAIPHVARDMSFLLPNFRKASSKVVDSPSPSRAFIWNLMWLVSESPSRFRKEEALYVAEDFILRNLGQKVSVADIAQVVDVSPRSLLTLFREAHGITVQEFVMRKRVQEATRLLLNTSLPIKGIALRVGMPDLQYFNKTMRAMTGLAPSRLRAGEKSGTLS